MFEGKTVLVTGGLGFIGSSVVRRLVAELNARVVNIDSETYAADKRAVEIIEHSERYTHLAVDLANYDALASAFVDASPDFVIHLAAESHVDKSIENPLTFVSSNVVGTCNLLQVTKQYLDGPGSDKKTDFRFHHVSTDEVYGDLGPGDPAFTELNSYSPSSPYSASKAASDHFVRAFHRSYGLPVLITNCSNNYGPFQHREKLIPTIICTALAGRDIPIYGDGRQVRDRLFVEDHVSAILTVLARGQVGETYNIGGDNEITNIDVAEQICALLDMLSPRACGAGGYRDLITYVRDRPGHDRRYAIDNSKVIRELEWRPSESFKSGLKTTVEWYLRNTNWLN